MRKFPAFLTVLALASHARAQEADLDTRFERDVLVIVATDFACHRFDIHVAVSPAQQRRGLMFVRDLPPKAGMLFVYPDEDLRSMWMKNTYIPLDIVFAKANGAVTSVAAHTEPLSLKSVASSEPVQFVLELNAGTTERLAIGAGSRLLWGKASPSR